MNDKILDIIGNYEHKEQILLTKLGQKEKHPATNGSYRESEWKSFFREIIPEKFSIKRNVFIIDAKGNVSDEVDLAIFDEQYTPYIFQDREYQYIPIEAVAAVVQCKSTSLEGVKEWANSISQLRTSDGAVTRMYGAVSVGIDKERPQTQTSTRPIKILCHMSNRKSAHKSFDLTIKAKEGKLTAYENENFQNLSDWYNSLNHYEIEESEDLKDVNKDDGVKLKDYKLECYKVASQNQEITIMSLNFKLNQLLMLINNPMFFPHQAYAKMFSTGLNQRKD